MNPPRNFALGDFQNIIIFHILKLAIREVCVSQKGVVQDNIIEVEDEGLDEEM